MKYAMVLIAVLLIAGCGKPSKYLHVCVEDHITAVPTTTCVSGYKGAMSCSVTMIYGTVCDKRVKRPNPAYKQWVKEHPNEA